MCSLGISWSTTALEPGTEGMVLCLWGFSSHQISCVWDEQENNPGFCPGVLEELKEEEKRRNFTPWSGSSHQWPQWLMRLFVFMHLLFSAAWWPFIKYWPQTGSNYCRAINDTVMWDGEDSFLFCLWDSSGAHLGIFLEMVTPKWRTCCNNSKNTRESSFNYVPNEHQKYKNFTFKGKK